MATVEHNAQDVVPGTQADTQQQISPCALGGSEKRRLTSKINSWGHKKGHKHL